MTGSPIKCLALVYTRLKDTKRYKYNIVSIQILIRSHVISVCEYTPLCNQIPYDKCLTFDRALHSKYTRDKKHTVTQPAHATFPSRDHHGLYIPSMLLFKLKGRARVMNVRLNLPDPTQHVPPMERMSHMPPHPKHHNNLIRDAAISLAQYDLHFWDTDEPIIPISHHILLNNTPDCTVLVHAITQQSTTSTLIYHYRK